MKKINLKSKFQKFTDQWSPKVIEEIIKIGKKKYDCYVLTPNSIDKTSLLKNKGEIKLWLSKDKNRLPIIIEQKAKRC